MTRPELHRHIQKLARQLLRACGITPQGARRPNGAQREAATRNGAPGRSAPLAHETPAPGSTSTPRGVRSRATSDRAEPPNQGGRASRRLTGEPASQPASQPVQEPCTGVVFGLPLHRPCPPHIPLELWLQLLSEDT